VSLTVLLASTRHSPIFAAKLDSHESFDAMLIGIIALHFERGLDILFFFVIQKNSMSNSLSTCLGNSEEINWFFLVASLPILADLPVPVAYQLSNVDFLTALAPFIGIVNVAGVRWRARHIHLETHGHWHR